MSSKGTRLGTCVNFPKSGASVKQAFSVVAVRSNLVMGGIPRASSNCSHKRVMVEHGAYYCAPARVWRNALGDRSMAVHMVQRHLGIVLDDEDEGGLFQKRELVIASTMRPRARSLSATIARVLDSLPVCRQCDHSAAGAC